LPASRGVSTDPFPKMMPKQPDSNDAHVAESRDSLNIRNATVADGARIWRLVHDCEVLDENSCYAYLLLCRDFSATTLVAEEGGELQGFVAAYIPPARPSVVFVWQIGADASARQKGVGKSLLRALLRTDACRAIRFLEATVTPSNTASARLFRSVAEEMNAGFDLLPGFQSGDFGNFRDNNTNQHETNQHEREDLVRIGPFREHA